MKIAALSVVLLMSTPAAVLAQVASPPPTQPDNQLSQMKAAVNLLNAEKSAAEQESIRLSTENDKLTTQLSQSNAKMADLQKQIDEAKKPSPPAPEKSTEVPKP
jgi:septal ring factor EnvC (AmiA/AmiB activator)